MNYCPSCGARVAGQRFCGQCGAPVDQAGASSRDDTEQFPAAHSPIGQKYRGDERYVSYGEGYAPDDGADSRRSRVAAILIGVAVVVVAAIALAVWQLSRPGDRPTPVANSTSRTSTAASANMTSTESPAVTTPATPTVTTTVTATPKPSIDSKALAAAREIDELLSQSASQRSLVVQAVTCSADPDQAVDNLDEALLGRAGLLDRVDVAPFGSLPQGDRMQSELRKAWELSKYADQNFLEWATDWRDTGTCRTTTDAYTAGIGQSQTARGHKERFAALWEKHVRAPMKLATKRTAADI